MLDSLLLGVMKRRRLKRFLTPLVRAYSRYSPINAGKRSLWTRVIAPCFAWQSHEFVATTVFGCEIAGNTEELLQQYIYYFGMWEPQLTRWLTRRLAQGDTFIDVGANIGYFSLLASRLVGVSGSVVAIEASPNIFSKLELNLTRNRVRNVRAVNVAASDLEGVVKLFSGPKHHIGLATIVEAWGETDGRRFETHVQCAPLAAILTPDEIKNARVLKIDVEGAESKVVAGMGPLLTSGRKDLEIALELRGGRVGDEIMNTLSAAGFHPYTLENDYSAMAYLPPHTERRPVRLRGPLGRLTDTIFSRRDAETL